MKQFLKSQVERAVSDSTTNHDTTKLMKWQATMLARKTWKSRCTQELTVQCSDFFAPKRTADRADKKSPNGLRTIILK